MKKKNQSDLLAIHSYSANARAEKPAICLKCSQAGQAGKNKNQREIKINLLYSLLLISLLLFLHAHH